MPPVPRQEQHDICTAFGSVSFDFPGIRLLLKILYSLCKCTRSF